MCNGRPVPRCTRYVPGCVSRLTTSRRDGEEERERETIQNPNPRTPQPPPRRATHRPRHRHRRSPASPPPPRPARIRRSSREETRMVAPTALRAPVLRLCS
ncbi:hypothetical protein VPH35_080059 [Triticum aestivum]